MDKFLEHSPYQHCVMQIQSLRLACELRGRITHQKPPNKETWGSKWFHWSILPHIKKKLMSVFLKFSPKIKEEGTFPNSCSEACITLIPSPDKDTTRRENYRLVCLMNIDIKYLQQNTSKFNSTAHLKDYKAWPVRFSPGMEGWFNISESINEIHHIIRTKDKITWSIQQMQ